MSKDHSSEKRRLHIVLSLDNPLQRETWLLLSQAKNKTSAVCEAVCGYQKQKSLEDTLRTVLREELKNIAIAQTVENEENEQSPETAIGDEVLGFLMELQSE